MTERRARWILADLLLPIVTMAAAYIWRFEILDGRESMGGPGFYLLWAALLSPLFPMLYTLLGVYEAVRPGRVLCAVWLGNTLAVMAYIDLVYLLHITDLSRRLLWIDWLLLQTFGAARVWISRQDGRVQEKTRTILVGAEEDGFALSEATEIRLVGSVGNTAVPKTAWLGPAEQLEAILLREKPELVILTAEEPRELAAQLYACDSAGVRPCLLPSFAAQLGSRPYLETVGDTALLNLRRVPLDDRRWDTLKRLGDILGAAALLTLSAPLMALAWVGVRLTSPGPAIFAQERVGRNNRPFRMYKFRTMAVGGPENGWTCAGDPRRTAFGAVLRRYSIDELPQLVNVLRGEMSLVGPRPELPCYVERFRREIPRYMVRHRVRPGLTGWAQVNGLRGDTSIPRRVEHDLWYIENWTPLLDTRILLLTPMRCLVNRQEPLKRPGESRRAVSRRSQGGAG